MTIQGPSGRAAYSAALALAAFILGCGGGGADSGTGPNPPPGGTPHPLTVQVTLDDQHAASAVVSSAGGTVSATAADGTRFTLNLPAGVLDEDQTIGLTPVSGITGLPLSGGLIAAVQLQPEGLGLLGAATLIVSPAAAIDPSKVVGFGYQGQGQDFHLEPEIGIGTVVFTLTHFSGYGTGSGSPADASAVQPTSAENQAKEKLVDLQRADPSGHWTAAELKTLRDIFTQWYAGSVQPQATAAQTDETKLIAASNDWMAWIVRMQIFFGDPGFRSELGKERTAAGGSLTQGYNNAINNGFTKCSDNHDLSQLQKMLTWASRAVRYTLEAYGFDAQLAQRNVVKCANFKLNFSSSMIGASPSVSYGSTLEGKDIAVLSRSGLTGGELDFSDVTGPLALTDNPNPPNSPLCYPWVASPQGSTLTAHLAIQFDPTSTAPAQVKLGMDPGSPQENWTAACPHNVTLRVSGLWVDGWMGFHSDELNRGVDKFVITDWEIVGGEVYARKTYSRTKVLTRGEVTESTVLELKHAPQK